jgi:DNA damage-inducible protein 1
MTIMSKSCAEKCGLLRLLDKKYSGVAKGVGTAKILGRIHLTQLQIGKSFFQVTITVLDQDGMEFLLGLDMLRRHQW